jgi:hypothetical protein
LKVNVARPTAANDLKRERGGEREERERREREERERGERERREREERERGREREREEREEIHTKQPYHIGGGGGWGNNKCVSAKSEGWGGVRNNPSTYLATIGIM